MFNIFKKKEEVAESVGFLDVSQKRMNQMACDYAKTVDKLILSFFQHKGVENPVVGFRRLTMLTHHAEDKRVEYYYKNRLVITIYPWEITRKGVDTKATLNYKLHYLEQEKDKC